MNEQITLAQSRAAFHQIGRPSVPRPASPWLALSDLMLPAIQSAREATERTVATQRCLGILNCVTRLEQQGVKVTTLADLKLPAEAITDPFTGKPLLMKSRPDGWLIYSVGTDLKDDGGQFDKPTDFGLGPVPDLPSLEQTSPVPRG
jgi:hypothetical protein